MARKMQDSGIEWIGEIPEGWEIHRIKTHFSIISGSGFKPELQGQSTGDFPVCKASDISSSGHYLHTSANYISSDIVKSQHFSIIPKGSILFAKIGEAMRKNNRSLCSLDCCVDNNCQGLVPKNISSEFSYYLFTCIDMTWFDNAGTIPCINNQKLYDCRIPFPSYDEQLLIANHLNIQCDKINEMLFHIRASIEEYKKLKQAVITQAVTKGIRGEREIKDSGVEWIGEIPAEWSITKIKSGVTKIGSGKTPSGGAETYTDSGVIFLRSQNVYDCTLNLESPTYISPEVDATMKSTRVLPDDVLLNITGGSIGRCSIVPKTLGLANVNQHVCIIRTNPLIFLPKYMQYFWVSTLGHLAIDLYQTGGNREGMSADAIRNTPIPYAPLKEQKEIVAYLDAKCAEIDGLIAKKEQLVKELESYKKSLIYEVVTGKREV
jgi:type I restriction enzyme S subunit